MIKKIILAIAILLFLLSFYPIYLIVYELMSDKVVANKYLVQPLEFNKDYYMETNDINSFYIVEDTPPYERVKNVNARHFFTDNQNNEKEVLTSSELHSEFNNIDNEKYYLTYYFKEHEIVIAENLKDNHDVKLFINGEELPLDKSVEVLMKEQLLNRYENLGFTYVEDKENERSAFVIVEAISDNQWNVYTLKETGKLLSDTNLTKENLNADQFMVKVINVSSVSEIGYKSSILFNYPMFYFPIFYPFLTFIISLLLIIYLSLRFTKSN